MVHHVLSVLIAGATHGEQVLAALQIHLLPERNRVDIAVFDRLNLRALKEGVGSRDIRPLLIPQGVGENRIFDRRVEANALPYREHLPL